MIPVYQIANDDFILISADRTVTEARETIRRLQPTAVVIRRRDKDTDTTHYYLYLAQGLLDKLLLVDAELILSDVLQLHEQVAMPVLDSYANAEVAPSRCVISDNNRIIGFYDAGLPPTFVAKDVRGNDGNADASTAPVARLVQTEFPDSVALGQTVSLLVSLVRETVRQSVLSIAVPIETQVDIVVQTQRGFALESSDEGSLRISNEEDSLPFQFKLRATEVGPGRIRILCFQGGKPLGEIILTPTVVAADQGTRREHDKIHQVLAPFSIIQPDLTLLIFEHMNQGQLEITLRLSAQNPDLGLNFKPFGPIKLRMNPLLYFQDFFKDIEGLPITRPNDQVVAIHKLARKGAKLFQDLLPENLRTLLWSLQDRIRTVQVLSDEPWIPWELLKLCGEENDEIVEGPFLCEAFTMTRWFPGIGRRPLLRLQRMAIVVPTDSGLTHVQNERAYLLSLANNQRQISEVPATYVEVLEALSKGNFDCWHFTGHGRFEASDPNRSALMLERHQRLCPEDLSGKVRNCGRAQPLVFLNACQTGREGFSLTGIGGWAHNFVEAGAAAFIGSLWSVYDKTASTFAQTFYNYLLDGETIGRAIREARVATQASNDLTWLAYTVFAEPLAKVE